MPHWDLNSSPEDICINNNKIPLQMSDFDGTETPTPSPSPPKKPPTQTISILKHLPQARKIMEGHSYQHQITKCIYNSPLTNLPSFVVPTLLNTQNLQLPNNRLFKIQDTLFEYQHVKDKFRAVLRKDADNSGELVGTLWMMYSGLVPSYMRFGAQARRNNFANILMPINGVHIQIGSKNIEKPFETPTRPSPLPLPDTVHFNSHFESGNLLYAYRKPTSELIETYDLILQNDTNTKGHNQWFYFKIHNTKKHNRIHINIVNFIKNQSMFSYGIKLLTFSQKDYARCKLGWVRDGEKIAYFQNNIRREGNGKSYYTLSFQYYFRDIDTVYFAPTHPYTYTQLTDYFDNLISQHTLSNFISIKHITETVGKNSVSVVTISTGKKSIKDCRIAWVLARQHPGETTSSFMVQGIINYLLALFRNPIAEGAPILDSLVFKIVPMVNVDGVVHGNSRAELTGVDPNRMWKKTVKRLCPSVSILKKLLTQHKDNTSLVLDLHSHSKKTGCFFYGNSLLHDPKSTKIYPTMVCDGDPRFQLKYCRFRGGYETTARSVIFGDLGIKQVYTVQCSLLGYLKKNRITQYKITDYYQMGKKLMEVYVMLERERVVKPEREIIQGIADRMIDKEDAESARSQSSLSDEQYEEIITKQKPKPKKKKQKKQNPQIVNPSLNPLIENNIDPKYFVKRTNPNLNTNLSNINNRKAELSVFQKKKLNERELSSNDLRNKFNVLNLKNFENKNLNMKENFLRKPLGKDGNLRKFGEKDMNQERKISAQFTQFSASKFSTEIVNIKEPRTNENAEKKQVQVQVSMPSQDRALDSRRIPSKSKTQNSLCIIGSSLQDDLIFIRKNQVGTQIYQQLIQQATSTNEAIKASGKMKRIPKILNYLCSNLIGIGQENSVLPQGRLAPIKKPFGISKI